MCPDDVITKTITVTWEAKEISSGAFRQDNNNGDHVIECSARRDNTTRTSTVTIESTFILLCQTMNICIF